MSKIKKVWDDLTGKTAAREGEKAYQQAREQAEADRIEQQNQAARQAAFAATEGEGVGSVGEISLGIDDKLDANTKKKKNSNLYL